MAQQLPNRLARTLPRRLAAAAVAVGVIATVTAGSSVAADQTAHPMQGQNRGFTETDLVSDLQGRAQVQDTNLKNSWGLSIRDNQLWVSDNATNLGTRYTGATPGNPIQVLTPVVNIPGSGAPTGNVRNDTDDFQFSGFGKTGTARTIFAGEEGDIFAFSEEVSQTDAVQVAHTETGGTTSVYKGLEIIPGDDTRGRGEREPELLAANFRFGRIDIFDGQFQLEQSNGRFTDPNIPDGFAPFNVRRFGDKVVVTYAKQLLPDKHDDDPGAGNGFVDVFDLNGCLQKRLVSDDVLNSPWGLEIAPRHFGKFSGDLLVGNFGDGTIHAFDLNSGSLDGAVSDSNGNPIAIDGLWGLQRGTDEVGGCDALWFAAGINGEADGLLGILRANR